MPRRPPPSALRLHPGPTPPRNQPRHTMPSVPRPIYQPPAALPKGPVPRGRTSALPATAPDNREEKSKSRESLQLPAGVPMLVAESGSPTSSPASSNLSTPSEINIGSGSSKFAPGPWDHSRSISAQIEIESMLTPPKPAAMGHAPGPFAL